MVLIVEDGAGLPDANSYVSLSEATELLSELSVTTEWTTLTDTLREALLARATAVIDADFAFRGEILLKTQSLAFPRRQLYDRDDREIKGVPRMVREATSEFAYALSKTDVIADPGAAAVDKLRVGPISLELSELSKVKKLMPDSVTQKLSLYGVQVRTIRRSRRLAY